jgi:hypothetical protein
LGQVNGKSSASPTYGAALSTFTSSAPGGLTRLFANQIAESMSNSHDNCEVAAHGILRRSSLVLAFSGTTEAFD